MHAGTKRKLQMKVSWWDPIQEAQMRISDSAHSDKELFSSDLISFPSANIKVNTLLTMNPSPSHDCLKVAQETDDGGLHTLFHLDVKTGNI